LKNGGIGMPILTFASEFAKNFSEAKSKEE